MRPAVMALVLLAGCGLLAPARTPNPPPSVADARALLDEVIDAGIARDFDRLCANATGTCESELEGAEDLAPTEPPVVVDVSIHEPVEQGGGWTSGGVLFVLCGVDAAGDAYESEVLVFDDDGRRLLAAAAVYWRGTRIGFSSGGDGVHVGGEPTPGPSRCP
jgi:hypothetical protein